MGVRGLCVVLFAVAFLAACGDGEDTEDVAEAAPPAPAAPPPMGAAEPPAAAQAPGPAPAEPPGAAAPAAATATPATPSAAAADGTYVGNGEAVEADVILVNDTRILLYGVDAIEPPQTCFIEGQPWECWPAAMRQLQTYLAEGPVTCTAVRPPDVFGRVLSLCEINGESLNEKMIRAGFAVAVIDEVPEFAAAEEAARAEGIGLWQGQFQLPEEWRADRGIQVRRP